MPRLMSRASGTWRTGCWPTHRDGRAGKAEVAAGSEILTVQELRIDEIGDVIHRRLGRAAGVAAIAVSDDLDYVRVGIQTARPGMVHDWGR